MPKQSSLPPTLKPRLVGREAASAYLCCSPSFFDELVSKGLVPKPRWLSEKRKAWDVQELDRAADALPSVKPQLAHAS